MSLTNTSIPCLNDNSLLEDALNLSSPTKEESGTATKHKELLQKLLSSAGGNDSMLQDDELAILGCYDDMPVKNTFKQKTETTDKVAKDVLAEYDEYEKQIMEEIGKMDSFGKTLEF